MLTNQLNNEIKDTNNTVKSYFTAVAATTTICTIGTIFCAIFCHILRLKLIKNRY